MYRKLTKKLFSLFSGELTAAIIFALVWLMFLNTHDWMNPYLSSIAPLFAFLFLEFLLIQGSYYWFLKWRQAKRRDFSILPKYQLKLFFRLKYVNLFLLGVGFVFVIYELIRYPKEFYWFFFLYIFALVEYINYYHVRLSYQSLEEMKEFMRHKKFRKSKLAAELKQLEAIS